MIFQNFSALSISRTNTTHPPAGTSTILEPVCENMRISAPVTGLSCILCPANFLSVSMTSSTFSSSVPMLQRILLHLVPVRYQLHLLIVLLLGSVSCCLLTFAIFYHSIDSYANIINIFFTISVNAINYHSQ